MQTTHEAEETASMPHESPLQDVHSHGSDEGSMQLHELMNLFTTFTNRIDGLEQDLQQTKKTYSTALTKLVLRVKKLEHQLKSGKAKRRARIVLSEDEDTDEEVHEKPSDDTEVLIQEETPTELVEDLRSGEKGEKEISTADIQVSTASPPKVSTVVVPYVYIRRSASKAKDKGKAIMEEPESPKKLKKKIQVQLSLDEELARKV
ncbi:hypothetical protein Tco_0803205 [Tanacetum coccineum]|uniref:Uncharacterized protein n=1 Tax=Tanacetum coccineum TaxID=301880 RepID=A0ABQ5A510_9ASTR